MKNKSVLLIITGLIGALTVIFYDSIMQKPTNDFTGPKSTPALALSACLIIAGIIVLIRKKPSRNT